MNALDMANLLDVTYGHYTEQEAEMLRKQHEAIRQLREALVQIMERDATEMLVVDIALAKAALAATEEFQK